VQPVRSCITLFLILSVTALWPSLAQGQTDFVVPPGFGVDVFYPGLSNPTSMAWGPDGNLYVSQQSGEIVELVIGEDGYPSGSLLVGKVPADLLGLVFVGSDLFVSYTGNVAKLTPLNRTISSSQVIVSGLPYGRHQNDEIVYGKDGFLYLGVGSTGDRTNGNDPRSATIVRFKPDGSGFEIFATGLRNPFGLAFDKDGNLFATDNGPDDPAAPDELNYITEGRNYGFPDYFGVPPNGSGTIRPVTTLQTHSSSDGFAFYYGAKFPAEYVGNAFIAQWGANSGDPNIGRRIVRVTLSKTANGFEGQEIVFATGFDHTIDMIDDRMSGLLVADHGSGTIYRISYGPVQSTATISTTVPGPSASELSVPEMLLLALVVLSVIVILLRQFALKTWRRTSSI
jgi:glucose/arabinose dehydrogenase